MKKKYVNPPKKGIFEFEIKTVKKIFSSYFSFVLALITIDLEILFWSVFLKTHKKTVIHRQKRPIWRFWRSITWKGVFVKNQFENENFDARGVRVHQNFKIGLLKLYLSFGYLTCSVRFKKNSTLHPTVIPKAISKKRITSNSSFSFKSSYYSKSS